MKKLRQLSEQIRENINNFIADAESNNSSIDKTVDIMKKQIQNAKEIVATAIADEQKLRRAYREAIEAEKRCENRISALKNKNNDQLVDEIQQQSRKYHQLGLDLEQRIYAQESFILDLKADLSEIYEQFRNTSKSAESLSHQNRQAKARAELQRVLDEFELLDPNTTLTEAEQQLKQYETEAGTWSDKAQQKGESRYSTENDFNIDEALADLKRDILGSSQND